MADEGEKTQSARKISVLYGSQTGTAQEVAERIGREAKRRYITAAVLPLDEYNVVSLGTYFYFRNQRVQFHVGKSFLWSHVITLICNNLQRKF